MVPENVSTQGLKLKLFGPSFEGSDKTPNGICVRDRCRNTSVNLVDLAHKQTHKRKFFGICGSRLESPQGGKKCVPEFCHETTLVITGL